MTILWKIGGIALAVAAAFFLVKMYGGSQYKAGQYAERALWNGKVAQAADAKLAGFQAGIALQRQGETVYQRTFTEKLVPVTKTIIERSTAYEATPAGQLLCLAPDRVHGLDEARGALFPTPAPATPGSDHGTVRPDAPVRE